MPFDEPNPPNEPTRSETSNQAFEELRPRLGQPIAFYRSLVPIAGGAKAAILLGQMLYWTRHGRGIQSNDGWFYKTAPQWRRETGLSHREQFSARAALLQRGLMEERLAGMPAKLHFRLNVKALHEALGGSTAQPIDSHESPRTDEIPERLGPASAFYPRLTQLTGGVNAALALSRTLNLLRRGQADSAGWMSQSTVPSAHELGLTLAEYQHARRRLRALGLWSMRLRGAPARTFVHIECEALARALDELGHSHARSPQAGKTECPPVRNARSSSCESGTLGCVNSPNKLRRLPQHSFAETPELIKGLTTGFGLQKPPERSDAELPPEPDAEEGEGLVFPTAFTPEQRSAAKAMLKGLEPQAQALLDEIAARLAMNLVRWSPIGYLQTLIGRARAGQFVPEFGPQVLAQRRQRAINEALLRARHKEAERAKAERSSPRYRETVERRREDIRRFLASARNGPARKR